MIPIYIAEYSLKEGEKKYQIEHRTGLELLRLGLEELYDICLDEKELEAQIGRGPHGKPFLNGTEDIFFNISHCDGLVVCGFDVCPLGIDLEKEAVLKKTLLKRILTESEQNFMKQNEQDPALYQELLRRFWTLKESYIKWNGMGFSFDPKAVSFEIKMNEKNEILDIVCSDERVCCMQMKIKEDTILSVCTERSKKEDIRMEIRKFCI